MKKVFIQVLMSIALIGTLFANLYIFKKNDTNIVLIAILLYFILSLALNKYKSPNKKGLDDALLIVGGLSMLLLSIFYLIGLKTGFNVSYNFIFGNYIKPWVWIKVFLIIILTELSRYIISQMKTKDKKERWLLDGLMFISFFLVDLTIVTKTYDYTIFNQLYEFVALVLVQSVAKNLLLNYITSAYGFIPCLVYRLVLDLYVFFFPVEPNLNMFIESVILLLFPYLIYVILKKVSKKRTIEKIKKSTRFDRIITVITTIIFVALVALVSREFTYCMIAIGSESMTGTANKGDAVVYKVYNNKKDTLEKGDIIVFKKNNVTVVHRIYNTFTLDGVDVYQTKGDANESADNWIVKKEDIVGKVKFRVLYIGWPSVWLSELF